MLLFDRLLANTTDIQSLPWTEIPVHHKTKAVKLWRSHLCKSIVKMLNSTQALKLELNDSRVEVYRSIQQMNTSIHGLGSHLYNVCKQETLKMAYSQSKTISTLTTQFHVCFPFPSLQ